MNLNPICHPLPHKKWNAHFWITFNFWWLAGLVDGLKPQPPPLFSQKMKSSFLDYIQLLMIGQAGQWTRTPSATPLQPKKWNAHFWITFTLDDWPGWSMDSNPIHHPSPANKMKCFFLDYVHYWWSARLVNGLEPHLPPLSTQKSEMIIFGLHSTSDDWPGWLMDSNPIHHNSSVKKWNPHFWITFNFWWSARLVNGLKPHLPPLSSQKNEMLIFGLCSTSDYWLAGRWTQTPSASPLQLIKWNAHFWNMFNFWWSAWLLCGLKPHLPALSSQKNEMLLFGLRSTSDDWLG